MHEITFIYIEKKIQYILHVFFDAIFLDMHNSVAYYCSISNDGLKMKKI